MIRNKNGTSRKKFKSVTSLLFMFKVRTLEQPAGSLEQMRQRTAAVPALSTSADRQIKVLSLLYVLTQFTKRAGT